MQTTELWACPICAGTLEPLGITEQYELKALGTALTIGFVMCANCRFVCQGNVLPLESLMRYYQDSPKLREALPSETDRSLYEAQSAFMAQAGPLRGTRVLDIGADMGKLLDHVRAAYACATYYEEENRTARAWLAECKRHSDAKEHADQRFDWIVLSQVLEHIVDPVPMLVSLRDRLTAHGKLFIEVPNHGLWDDLDVGFFFEHVNYFSPASLCAALDRAGYHVLSLSVTTDPHYFEGRCRIIRVCAQLRPTSLIEDAAEFVRAHDRKQKLARVQAVAALCRELSPPGQNGVALYGAAELATIVLRHIGQGGGSITAVFDSDSRKHGIAFGEHIVQPPSEIVNVNPGAIVILSSAEADIRRSIERTGYRGRVVCWSDLGHG